MTAPLLYVTGTEISALAAAAVSGPDIGVRMLRTGVDDDGREFVAPEHRDALGLYPRWIVLRLAILRDLDITSENITDAERAELRAFAADHGKELVG